MVKILISARAFSRFKRLKASGSKITLKQFAKGLLDKQQQKLEKKAVKALKLKKKKRKRMLKVPKKQKIPRFLKRGATPPLF